MPTPFVPATITYSLFRTLCRIITSVTLDLKVYGVEHVPPTGGVLILSNHHSFLDPPCIGVQIRRPVSYLAKSELFDVPVFGKVIPKLNAFPVRQGAGDVGAVRETIKRLKEGHVLTVFPEGSRSSHGQLQQILGGFTLIVRKAGVPIVPAVIDGTFEAWPMGRPFPRSSPVRVMFGPAMHVSDLKPAEIISQLDSTWHSLLAELRAKQSTEV